VTSAKTVFLISILISFTLNLWALATSEPALCASLYAMCSWGMTGVWILVAKVLPAEVEYRRFRQLVNYELIIADEELW
jgi:hypothetical protein